MPEYIALLRAVNVGTKNRITMEELRGIFASKGYAHATTYLQSGNVRFSAKRGTRASVRREIEEALSRRFKYETAAILRTPAELVRVVRAAPFGDRNWKGAAPYITFLERATRDVPPKKTPNGDLEVVHVEPAEVYSVARKVKGRSGNPNAFVEKHLKTRATTRNWNVVRALAEPPK